MSTATIPDTATPGDAAAVSNSPRRSPGWGGWGFAAPFAVVFLLFLVWPVIYGFWLSFTDESLTGAGGDLVGFANYAEAFADADMWRGMANTLVFTLLSTVPLVVIALVLALLAGRGRCVHGTGGAAHHGRREVLHQRPRPRLADAQSRPAGRVCRASRRSSRGS